MFYCRLCSIDGYRLRSYFTLEVKTNAHCTDDVTGKNDLAALCRELLAAHHIQGELWAALIVRLMLPYGVIAVQFRVTLHTRPDGTFEQVV